MVYFIVILPTTVFQRANATEWNDYLYCRSNLPFLGILLTLLTILVILVSKINKKLLISSGIGLFALFRLLNLNHSKAYSNVGTFYTNAIGNDSSRAFFHEIMEFTIQFKSNTGKL